MDGNLETGPEMGKEKKKEGKEFGGVQIGKRGARKEEGGKRVCLPINDAEGQMFWRAQVFRAAAFHFPGFRRRALNRQRDRDTER